MDIIGNSITFLVVLVYLLLMLLPKFWKYISNGMLLAIIATLAILADVGKITFNIMLVPVFRYVVIAIIILGGKYLIVEGVKEHTGLLKKVTISMGIFLIVMTSLPELYHLGALSFSFPELPALVIYSIYLAAGLLIIIGAFAIKSKITHE